MAMVAALCDSLRTVVEVADMQYRTVS